MKTTLKNLFFSNGILFSIVFLTVFFTSCEKNESDNLEAFQTEEITIKKNILAFENINDFSAFIEEDVTAKKKSLDFISFDDLYQKALNELNETINENDRSQILQKYNDVITISDGNYVPLINNVAYRKIINRERLYISGDYIHKIIDNQFLVFTEKENAELLRNINSLENIDDTVFRTVEYQGNISDPKNSNSNVKADVGYDGIHGKYKYSHKRCRKERLVKANIIAFLYVSGDNFRPGVSWTVEGFKGNIFCGEFRSFYSILHAKNVSHTITFTINGINHDLPKKYYDASYSSSKVKWKKTKLPLFRWIKRTNKATPRVTFTQAHLEASSGGLNQHYLVLNRN